MDDCSTGSTATAATRAGTNIVLRIGRPEPAHIPGREEPMNNDAIFNRL